MTRGDRRQRLRKILELISTHAIRTQEEMAEALAREGAGGASWYAVGCEPS